MRKEKLGNTLIAFSLSITALLWLLAKTSLSEITIQPLISLNQITALLGSTLFVWSMILSTRLDFLEDLFGGLDKFYKIHRRVSEIGAFLILIHPIALAINSAKKGLEYFLPVHNNPGINLGVYSFWIFLFAVVLTLIVKKINFPYHIWKHTHKFLNLAMIFALLHVAIVRSDTSFFLPLGIWMNTLIGLGVAAGIYKTFFYNSFGPKYKYKVEKINRYDNVHDIYLKPVHNKLNHGIAQYAYVSFLSEGLSQESHPYCISSLPNDNLIRFSIKELGDYTKNLNKLEVDDTTIIFGPYGNLGIGFQETKSDSVFIAGGIGIAPFLSMFRKAVDHKNIKTSLFYCTKYKNEASFEKELQTIAQNNPHLNYYNQCSREPGGCHLKVEQIINAVHDIKKTNIYLCGPTKMMTNLKKDLISDGFLDRNIYFEDFDMI